MRLASQATRRVAYLSGGGEKMMSSKANITKAANYVGILRALVVKGVIVGGRTWWAVMVVLERTAAAHPLCPSFRTEILI